MDVAGRADRVRAGFDAAAIDALLVTDLSNVRYLTGFTGSAGRLLVTAERMLLVTDGRYAVQAPDQIGACGAVAEVAVGATIKEQDATLAAAAGPIRLGLEAASISWADQRRVAGAPWTADLVATDGVVEGPRQVKDAGEVARLARAAALADAALVTIAPMLNGGPTETEVGFALDTEMRRLGADGVSFETIVASGPNGARPHHRPGDRRIVDGDLVVIDFGALVDGYHSDMTRTFMVGEATATQQRMYDVVLAAQQAGVAAVRAGVEAREVDRTCRDVIAEAGWADAFGHGTGHGVGLVIHEDPRVSRVSTATLAAGHVVTVEPGVYLPDHGGVRIEDTVVVTDEGCSTLTLAPKDPSPAPA
ncbi:aminopeptidase P family protein [Iamia sp. SCSIO 61187]|uniref:M24 family metallopeptidase n=1 Tax=Iamia sp. SCSIO 61187 TaxID=2722752 RepID=UPI00351D7F7D|nr:aminopeptidase P family protein [Iamia sp. SCSIO 61187]